MQKVTHITQYVEGQQLANTLLSASKWSDKQLLRWCTIINKIYVHYFWSEGERNLVDLASELQNSALG